MQNDYTPGVKILGAYLLDVLSHWKNKNHASSHFLRQERKCSLFKIMIIITVLSLVVKIWVGTPLSHVRVLGFGTWLQFLLLQFPVIVDHRR